MQTLNYRINPVPKYGDYAYQIDVYSQDNTQYIRTEYFHTQAELAGRVAILCPEYSLRIPHGQRIVPSHTDEV